MSRNIIFWIFFGYSVYPLGGLENWKKLEFLHFCQILDVFGLSNQYNHEKSTEIKVILEICSKVLKSTNNPGGNPFSEHHGGLNGKILSKKRLKMQFFILLTPWNMPNMHKNHSRQTRTLYGWNESSTCTDRLQLCTPRGVKFAYFVQKWPKILAFC